MHAMSDNEWMTKHEQDLTAVDVRQIRGLAVAYVQMAQQRPGCSVTAGERDDILRRMDELKLEIGSGDPDGMRFAYDKLRHALAKAFGEPR